MFEIKDQVVLEVLYSLQTYGEAAIFGGYIRDTLLNIQPKDVDIATSLSAEEVISLYPKAHLRESLSGYTIISFTIQGRIFEVVPNSENLLDKSLNADVNINSLIFDGESLIDFSNSLPDFEKKIIRSLNDKFKYHVHTSPFIWFKPIRLSSVTGFTLDKNLINILKETKEIINLINKSIKIQDGYKILNGNYAVLALSQLSEIGLLTPFKLSFDPNLITLPNLQSDYHLKLVIFAYATSYSTITDFLELFDLPQHIKSNFHTLISLLNEETTTTNFKLLNQKLLLQRLLFKK